VRVALQRFRMCIVGLPFVCVCLADFCLEMEENPPVNFRGLRLGPLTSSDCSCVMSHVRGKKRDLRWSAGVLWGAVSVVG